MLLPMTRELDGTRLIGVPESVKPGPPTESDVLPCTPKAEGLAVKDWPATVKIDDGAAAGFVGVRRVEVLLPITREPEGARLTGVPDSTKPGPPAESVFPWTLKPEGLAVKDSPPTAKMEEGRVAGFLLAPLAALLAGSGGPAGGDPPESTTSLPDGARESLLPATVAPGPPTDTLVPAITTTEGSDTVICCPRAVNIAGSGKGKGVALFPI